MEGQSGLLDNLITTGLTAICRLIFVWLLIQPMAAAQTARSNGGSGVAPCNNFEIFTRPGCPHCERAKEFLQKLQEEYPEILITEHVVPNDQAQLQRLFQLAGEYGVSRPGVPAFLICGNFFIGFDTDDTTGKRIKTLLGKAGPAAAVDETIETQSGKAAPAAAAAETIDTPWFGSLSAGKLGLPLFTIAIGLIDGFNPCAMWVLLVLLSLLVNLRDRKRLLLIAGTFVFASGAVYFAFMAAWLNLYLVIGFSRTIQVIIGLIALLIGTIHIKDFFAFKEGVSLSIPDSVKPGIYQRIRSVIYAQNLLAACLAVTIVAVLVNLVELLCTAGFPAVYTQILTARQLPPVSYYGYLLLYNLAYIFDDTLMLGIAVITLSSRKMQMTEGRWLKLLSGAVILLVGMTLILFPDLLV